MRSTTLKFGAAERRSDPLYFVARAFPNFFERSRRTIPRYRRWLYSRPIRWLRSQLVRGGPTERHTVVEAIRIDERPLDTAENWRIEQLHLALDRLNQFLLAAATVHGDPELAPVAPQDLPPVVFGMGWDIPRRFETFKGIDFWSYLVHSRIPDRPRRPLTRAEADLAMWMSIEHEHPLVPSSHLFLSAEQAMHRGRLTHAVVDAGTAVEMLIAGAIRILAEEHSYTDEKLRGVLQAPFASLAKDHFAVFMGYAKDTEESSDALGLWWQTGYRIRHAVVHEGRKVTEREAEEALGSALQLQRDFVDRLRTTGLGDKLPGVPDYVKRAADAAREAAGDLEV